MPGQTSERNLDALLGLCQRKGGDVATREFGLTAQEKSELFLALQLKAEQALDEIRLQAQASGEDQQSKNEINAEIQVVQG